MVLKVIQLNFVLIYFQAGELIRFIGSERELSIQNDMFVKKGIPVHR